MEKFKSDWEAAFPGVPTPDLSCFDSKILLENKIKESEDRIENLKFELSKEQFILDKLKAIEKDESSYSKDNKTQIVADDVSSSGSINENKINDNDLSSDDIVIIENNDEVGLKVSINDEERFSSQEFVTIVNPSTIPLREETIEINIDPKVIRSASNTSPSNNSLSTFCFGSKSSSDKCSTSSSQSSLNELFTSEIADANDSKKFQRFSNIKTYNKSYSEQEDDVFDYSGHNVSRRLTDPFPLSPKEPKGKPLPAPRTLSRSKPLPPLPKRQPPVLMEKKKSLDLSHPAKLLHNDIEDDNDSRPQLSEEASKKTFQESSEDRTFSQTSSAYEDDEHIYTDINELNIRRKLTSEVEESYSDISSDEEQIYENSNMQPKIQPLVDNSDSVFYDKSRKQSLKRRGSSDRHAIVLPEDIQMNNQHTGQVSNPDLEAILNGSKESLVDDIDDMPEKPPKILIENRYHVDEDDEDDDDDEHIYANVDDLILGDDDGSCDSISMGLPSPHYKELTSAQIESMLQKIQNNTSDHSHGKLFYIVLIYF